VRAAFERVAVSMRVASGTVTTAVAVRPDGVGIARETVGTPAAPSSSVATTPAGVQKRSMISTAVTETIEATTSVISTVMKFEVTNWARPNETPATRAIGQVCRSPRRPSTRNTRISGTTAASTGVCRPAIWASVCTSMPVTPESAMIGAPIAPKATGAVLAISDTIAAFSGFIPAAISIAIEMATGAPKPARDSRRAPKQNAMMIARMRWSSLIARMRSPSTSNQPVMTVSR